MLRKSLTYIIILLWATNTFAESYIVKDSVTNEVLPFAEIQITYLKSPHDTVETYTTTNNEGVFNILDIIPLKIKISYLGYESITLYDLPTNKSIIYLKSYTYTLDEVIVTGTFLPIELKESVFDVKRIDGKTIDSKAIVHIGEALNRELSFRTNNGHVNETAIMMNGLSGNHIKLLIDGVPVEGRLNGNIDLSQILTSNIDRIEVIDGPSSVTYGTNALGGTINIITKKYQIQKWTAYIKAYYESIGQYNVDGTVGFRWKKNQCKVSIGKHYFDGYSSPDTSRFKTWKPREQSFGTLMYTRAIHLLQLSFINDIFYEKMTSRGNPNPPYLTTAFDTYYQTSRYTGKVLLTGKVSPTHYMDGTISYSYFGRIRNIYYKDLTTLSYYPTDGESDQDTTRYHALLARGIFTQKKDSSNISYQIGGEIKSDFISAQRIFNNRQSLYDISLLASADYRPIHYITLKPALRISYNSAYQFSMTPSLHILMKPSKDVDIKFSYARGFRAPELKELYLEFHYNSTINLYGNTALKPEYSHHLQCNIDIDKSWRKHILNVSYKLYYANIKNRIALQQISPIDWKYFNSDNYTVYGLNIMYNYRYDFIKAQIAYNCNATRNATFDDYIAHNKAFYNHTFTTETRITYAKWKTSLDIDYKYNGKVKSYYITDNQALINSSIGAYHILDISMNIYFLNDKLQGILGVKNLTHSRQVNFVGDIYGVSNQSDATTLNVQWGRSFFTSLIFRI